jgi:hypothetical protein
MNDELSQYASTGAHLCHRVAANQSVRQERVLGVDRHPVGDSGASRHREIAGRAVPAEVAGFNGS